MNVPAKRLLSGPHFKLQQARMLVAVELFIRHEACGHGQGDPVGRRGRILAILCNG
ncbi:hypothetical protein POS17_4632 [Pseudomonas sp. Os17]|nr:hypothetical protein POS17_4632 [Pseudomonas sp. Os17]BAQ82518.1 hypothetical protein PST29_4629 [Pseudomonas sp. St29]